MNKKLILSAGLVAAALTACGLPADDSANSGASMKTKSVLETEKDKYSYALGAHFGNQAHFQLVTRDSIDLDIDLFIQAFKERYNEDSTKFLMNDTIVFETLNKLSSDRQAEKVKKDSIAAEANKAAGEAFLAKNKTAEGVITTESGLQYKVITEGTGAAPADGWMVKVHYTGTLLDGTKFDSSVDRGQPADFPVNAVIPGWTEMLKLMKVGSKVQTWIPSNLAYGPSGRPGIPANSTLVFDVELLDATAPAAEAPAAEAKPEPAKKAPAKKAVAKPAAAPADAAAPAAAPEKKSKKRAKKDAPAAEGGV